MRACVRAYCLGFSLSPKGHLRNTLAHAHTHPGACALTPASCAHTCRLRADIVGESMAFQPPDDEYGIHLVRQGAGKEARCSSKPCKGTFALDEVVFNTTSAMLFPEDGPKPLGKVHEASFLPPAAAAAAQQAQARANQGGAPGAGGDGGEGGEPQPQQSFLRKYWMYILPVMVLMMAGGGPEEGDGKGEGRPAAAAGSGAARRK